MYLMLSPKFLTFSQEHKAYVYSTMSPVSASKDCRAPRGRADLPGHGQGREGDGLQVIMYIVQCTQYS